jgi:NitT/TauT family transport system substrate-binding protein
VQEANLCVNSSRITTAFASAILSALALSGCSRSAPSNASGPHLTKVTLQMDWYPEAEQGGNYQALAKGFYRDAGLDVDIVNGGPGGFPLQKVAGGVAEFALGRSDDVILATSRHLPLMIVGAYMEKDPMAVMVHDESPVKDFPDLAGRALMVDPVLAWIPYLKAKYNMDFAIIPLNYGLSQFMADKNFIIQGFATSEPYFVQQHGVASRILLIANSGYNPYRVIYSNSSFVRDHPEVVRAFVAATQRGWEDFLGGDPTPAKKLILARNQAMTEELLAFSSHALKEHGFSRGDASKGERLGLMTPRRMQEQVDIFVRLKVLSEALPLEKFVSFDFVPPEAAPQTGSPK